MKQTSEACFKTAIVGDVMMDDEKDVNDRMQPLVAQISCLLEEL